MNLDLEKILESLQEMVNTIASSRHDNMDDVEDDFILNDVGVGEEMTKQVPLETLNPPKNHLNYD
jgi:hypothetical protein